MLSDIFLLTLIFTVITFLFSSSGSIFFQVIENREISLVNPVIIGFSIYLILLYIFYFVLYFSLTASLGCSIAILSVVSFFSLKKNYRIIKLFFFENIFIIFPSLFIFTTFAFIYEDNFFVFRGNHWDYFYYLSQSILTHKYSYPDLLELNNQSTIQSTILKNGQDFIPYYFNSSFDQVWFNNERVAIFLVFGSLFAFPFKNIFFAAFVFKVFLSSLSGCALLNILKYLKVKKYDIFFLSICFSLSFWIIYLSDSEALAQLAAISIFICLIFNSVKFTSKVEKISSLNIYILCLLISALYILYFELFVITILFYFFRLSLHYMQFIKIFLKYKINFLHCFFFFFLIILISYENTLSPIFDRIFTRVIESPNSSITSPISLWGYYGAFILGKESIVINQNIVKNLLDFGTHLNNFSLIITLVKLNIENGFDFFYLNIIPSLAGLYYFGILQKTNLFFSLSLFCSVFINIYLINNIFQNIKNLISLRNSLYFFFRDVFIFLVFINLYFFYMGELYVIIKIYFSFSFIIFIFLSVEFTKKKFLTNFFFVLLILLFVIYKFTLNNHGINRLDSFPSVLNSKYKNEFNWKINNSSLNDCKNYNNLILNFDNDKFQWIKYNFINIRTYNYKNNKKPIFNCDIKEENNSFIILKQK